MPDGGETDYQQGTGDYTLSRSPGVIRESTGEAALVQRMRRERETNERAIAHTKKSIVPDNGEAILLAGTTAKSDRDKAYEEYGRLTKLAKERKDEAYNRELNALGEYYRNNQLEAIGNAFLKGENFIQETADANTYKNPDTDFLSPEDAKLYNDSQKIISGGGGGVAHAFGSGLIDATGVLSESYPEGSKEELHAQASSNEHPVVRSLTGLAGIFFVAAKAKGSKAPAKGAPATTGEPVSVSNGEYLETWKDFLIPGTFGLNGARYMGLKLGLPSGYESPLGSCQISMFDEIFSNPERGKLIFHNDEGKRIGFDRPFNFLPSTNAGYPHLELKAPWLKELQLKDRGIVKHFKQYDDGFYRLEKIEDLNGHALAFTRTEAGLLSRVDGPDGLSLAFENDANGRRVSITLIGTDGSELELARYAYDGRGRMTSADCTFAMSVRYRWQDTRDLLASWHDASGTSETHFTYDEAGRVVHTRTSGIWNDDRFRYADGETTYLPGGGEGSAQRFQYDEHENITAEIDVLGGTVAHRYDANGFRIATADANGYESRTRYDAQGNIREVTDAEGRSTIYGWGDNSELMIVIDGVGNRKTYEHDDQANVVAETDAEGNTTQIVRDEKGRAIETCFPNGAIEGRSWDEYNRLASVTDAKGNTTRFDYDSFGRLVAITDPLGQVTRRTYQAGPGGFDMPSAITRPDGVTVARGFDGQGYLASVIDGEGRAWTYRHGAFGVLQSIVDPMGGQLSFDYDIEGRLTGVTNALGRQYRYFRDAAGRVVEEEDFDGRVKKYRRDAAGQVNETIKPDGAKLSYDYDKSGLLKRIESFGPDGKPEDVTRFWYDGRGLLERAENKAALVEFERDKNGRIVGETLNGKRIKSKRDAMGNRVLRELTGEGGGIVEYVRDPLGAVEKLIAGETSFTFKHDALGRETAREMAGFALAQRFDAANQLVAQSAGAKRPSQHGVSRLGWNVPLGEGTTRRDGNARRLYEYDRAFAPVRIDDALWGETRLDYDDNGQLSSTESPAGSERFTYDAARNLAGASSSAPFSSTASGYGPAFDAAFGTVTPAGQPARWQATPGGVVQIARGPKGERIQLTHDDCGRLIERRVERDGFRPQRWRYRWDAHDRLASVTTIDGEEWFFRYDPFGRRVSKIRRFSQAERERALLRWPDLVGSDGAPKAGRTNRASPTPSQGSGLASPSTAVSSDLPMVGTAYLWDGDHMIAEAPLLLDGRVLWAEATQWHFEEGTHRLLAKQLPSRAKMSDGSVLEKAALFPVVCDHLGTPKEMFDAKGNLVWAADHHVWGAVRSARLFGNLAVKPTHNQITDEFACPWRFPGQYEDAETGLYYNRHRYYDPLTGQYASPDPIGLKGGDRPQGYVRNPTVWTDSLGLSAWISGHRFRGEGRSPSEVFRDGISPKGTSDDLFAHALDNSSPASKYVATTTDEAIAVKFAKGKYVYEIDKRVGGINVNKNLKQKSPFPHEMEMAVPDGIAPSNIIGARQVLSNGELGPFISNPNYIP